MSEFITMQEIDEARDAITLKTGISPEIGIVLGSGLGDFADSVESPVIISTNEIPHWPVSTVAGHKGHLVIGKIKQKDVIVLQGRSHFYEGHSISRIGFPIRVMQRLGMNTLILTNAAGGINSKFSAGDLMILTDHIAFVGMAGSNPLMGPNLDEFGPRFPDMSKTYSPELIALAQEISIEKGLACQQGVYVWLSGPSFETAAEIRFLRAIGADAVGMSTVPEAIVAAHGGLKVLGVSGITNKVDPDGTNMANHEEVLAAGKTIVPKLITLLNTVIDRL